jgi:hypothetical protein
MTPEEVKAIVNEHVQRRWDTNDPISNPHGVNLDECLLHQPERRIYLDSFNKDQPIELWLVLEEDPERHAGYEVVFDENRNEFGLAAAGWECPVFIGYYGSFLDTLAGM